jgi:AcrR family transcriptional regulator
MENRMSSENSSRPSRVERKKEETKSRIVATAVRLFKEQGFEITTMEQIAAEVDIAKGTLYNYFPVKEAILSEYIQRSFSEKNATRTQKIRQLPDTRSRLTLVLSELMEGVQAQREIFEKFLVYEMQQIISLHPDQGIKSGIRLLAVEIITLGQKNGEIRNDVSLSLLMGFFDFIFIGLAQQFYIAPEKFNARECIAQCIDLFMNGAFTFPKNIE